MKNKKSIATSSKSNNRQTSKQSKKNQSNQVSNTSKGCFEKISILLISIICILLFYIAEILISSHSHQNLRIFENEMKQYVETNNFNIQIENTTDDANEVSSIGETIHSNEIDIEINDNKDENNVDIPYEKYIELIPGKKTGIRQDRRVVFGSDFVFEPYTRPPGLPSTDPNKPRALQRTEEILKKHPFTYEPFNSKVNKLTLEDTIISLQKLEICQNKPIFLTMATVGDDLYWQLIENFVYTMVKYSLSECSFVICVTDSRCMDMCKDHLFPCYNYVSSEHQSLPSVMEQIAEVKLLHIPKALSTGVSVFMLDLDVGFLSDPMLMVKAFVATPNVDIFVQEDMIFIMDRHIWLTQKWKLWHTEPLPNIGLFLCRGNNKTSKVFEIAWERYSKMTDSKEKSNPGKDQNHVLEGMRYGRAKFGIRYAYFDNETAVLLDKMVLLKYRNTELGGMASASILQEQKSIAMHTTCYEHSTKVMGLKATNAFWNPEYYNPLRRTITKQLLFVNEAQLLDEVRSLVWLAIRTNRALVLPNILGSDDIKTVASYDNHKFWPGFRVIHFKRVDGHNTLKVDVLEPAFYWRISRDYDEVPKPKFVFFHPKKHDLNEVYDMITKDDIDKSSRLVLHGSMSSKLTSFNSKPNYDSLDDKKLLKIINNVAKWADDSVGWYENSFTKELFNYGVLASVKTLSRNQPLIDDALKGMRACQNIFGPHKGNRSCFQICD